MAAEPQTYEPEKLTAGMTRKLRENFIEVLEINCDISHFLRVIMGILCESIGINKL